MSPKKSHLIETKYGRFSAIIWHEKKEKLFLVKVESFDKSMTQGSSLAEAKRMAKDLIELLCECAFDEGKVVIDETGHVAGRGKIARVAGPALVTV